MNYYRKSLEMMGTPIRIQFQNSENPFETTKQKLTVSQERQRKRLTSALHDRKK